MKEVTKTVYVSADGTEHPTPEECRYHESRCAITPIINRGTLEANLGSVTARGFRLFAEGLDLDDIESLITFFVCLRNMRRVESGGPAPFDVKVGSLDFYSEMVGRHKKMCDGVTAAAAELTALLDGEKTHSGPDLHGMQDLALLQSNHPMRHHIARLCDLRDKLNNLKGDLDA